MSEESNITFDQILELLDAETVLQVDAFRAAYSADEPLQQKQNVDRLRARALELGASKTAFQEMHAAFKAQRSFERKRAEEAQREEERAVRRMFGPPAVAWIDSSGILDEVAFVQEFNSCRGLHCVNGRFYTTNEGFVPDNVIRAEIYTSIAPYFVQAVARKVEDLFKALKNETFAPVPVPRCDRIFVKNGYVEVDTGRRVGDFEEFTFYRMAVDYDRDAPAPERWLSYMADLLEPDDILTLQEFLGYCMIPTTKAQKMLFLIGEGGEGKTIIGTVAKALFGESMAAGSLHNLEERFGLAEIEGKLLFVDDDLKTEGLRESSNIKTLVTAAAPVRIERKGLQAYQANVFCRLMAFGNQMVDTLYDHSNGVYRRRLILTTKPRPADRVDNPALADEIIANELPGVFLWMYEGLRRLISNGYRFTISDRAKQTAEEVLRDTFSPAAFFEDRNAVRLGDQTKQITSKALYEAYCAWCEDNAMLAVKQRQFLNYAKQYARKASDKVSVKASNHVPDENGNDARGFRGIEITRFRRYTGPLPFDE